MDRFSASQSNLRCFKFEGIKTLGSRFGFNSLLCHSTPLKNMGAEVGDPTFKLVAEVVSVWKRDGDICQLAAIGKLANIGNAKSLTRKDVDCNHALLEPVLVHFGISPAIKYW